METYPSYLELHRKGILFERIEALEAIAANCTLCPRNCGVNRIEGEKGVCDAGNRLVVSSAFPHMGEEAPLTGQRGSGTIFFGHCNLKCIFCQNHEISHTGEGKEVTVSDLADMMINLQRSGCHNVNLVTPTHFAHLIISALPEAIDRGLEIPLVWNCGGFESVEVIRLLDGIVDIYMPDIKYGDDRYALKYSKAPFYFRKAKEALKEMHRQVGDLELNDSGIAKRGLIIRHLLMPGEVARTEKVLAFIADEISKDSYLNIMDQYHPCYRVEEFPEINRRISETEYNDAITFALNAGLNRTSVS